MSYRYWLLGGLLLLGWTPCLSAAGSGPMYDLVVVQGTPAGITMAVRAAREGLKVALVHHNGHLGGMPANGLGVWDTLYEGARSPIYDEVRQAIFDHYRDTYGAESVQYRQALPGKTGHTNGKYEARVAEQVFTRLVRAENHITLMLDTRPVAVLREGPRLLHLVVESAPDGRRVILPGRVFADCTYEGDLAALAGAPFRVGREPRAEFNEPHAGRIFMRSSKTAPSDSIRVLGERQLRLNLRQFGEWQEIVAADGTGEGDGLVQAFNYRTILSSDPTNRLEVVKPDLYDPEFMRTLEFGSIVQPLPNDKIGWNRPQLVGRQTDYVEGNADQRQAVMDAHWQATMGMLYFLRNDPSVSEKRRAFWSRYGLARDAFPDNQHRPYEFYVREARRIEGLAMMTEWDFRPAEGYERAPVKFDSIAVTDWYLDTHACTKNRVDGSLDEGKMMLHRETFPAQVPFRALLAEGAHNLLVPVCLSSTHVAWGALRLEPTWMNIAEAAAFAVVQARAEDVDPPFLNLNRLLYTLADRRVMISFFNDVDLKDRAAWVSSAQFFGARGLFSGYDVRPQMPLTRELARVWVDALRDVKEGRVEVGETARRVAQAEKEGDAELTGLEFLALAPDLLGPLKQPPPNRPLNRREALEWMWIILGRGQ